MKHTVLCVHREALITQSIPKKGSGIYPIDLDKLTNEDFQFLNRAIVDHKEQLYFKVATQFPQILVYTMIRFGDEVLTYSRQKGAETLLHGSRSLGFGGHVDLADILEYSAGNVPVTDQLVNLVPFAAERELKEELQLETEIVPADLKQVIVDMENTVGSVHVGLVHQVVLNSKDDVCPNEAEIADPQWVSIAQLKQDIDYYENWSKLLINTL